MSEPKDVVELDALKRADQDRYLSTLFAPVEKRDALVTLYLFNSEIASVRDRVREPMAGEMRIQWWRDALAPGSEGGAGHPLAEALLRVIAQHRLPVAAFDAYLEARVFDLYDDPMPSRTDLEGYCGETASSLIQLASLILDPDAAARFSSAAGHAGCAQGIAGLLRLLPLHRSRGQCFVPADVLSAAGTDAEAFLHNSDPEASRRVVEAMVALGSSHFKQFGDAARGMPPSLRPAYLPASLSGAYLSRVGARPRDTLTDHADISVPRRYLTLLLRAMRGWD
jgi:phytoene synthase